MLFKTLVSTHGTLTVPAIAAVSFFPILQVVKAHLGNMLMAKGFDQGPWASCVRYSDQERVCSYPVPRIPLRLLP